MALSQYIRDWPMRRAVRLLLQFFGYVRGLRFPEHTRRRLDRSRKLDVSALTCTVLVTLFLRLDHPL